MRPRAAWRSTPTAGASCSAPSGRSAPSTPPAAAVAAARARGRLGREHHAATAGWSSPPMATARSAGTAWTTAGAPRAVPAGRPAQLGGLDARGLLRRHARRPRGAALARQPRLGRPGEASRSATSPKSAGPRRIRLVLQELEHPPRHRPGRSRQDRRGRCSGAPGRRGARRPAARADRRRQRLLARRQHLKLDFADDDANDVAARAARPADRASMPR